jgi:O-antigen/teichoic acid export membrane protein
VAAAIEMSAAPPGAARSVSTVAVAVAVSSAAGYALLLMCGRALSPADFAVLLAFWGVSFGLGSARSPLEQETAPAAAADRVAGTANRAAAWQVMGVGFVVVLAASAVLLTPPVARSLLGADRSLMPLVVLAALGFVVQFVVRGLLIGHGAVRPYGWLLVSEPAIRLLVVTVVLIVGAAGLFSLSLGVALGSFGWLAVLVSARALLAGAGEREPWLPVVRRVLALVAAASLTAAVITGYPALVTALTPGRPDAELGALFAALTVARIPLIAVTPLQALAVPAVVTALGREHGGSQVRRWLVWGLLATVVVSAAGGLLGALIGSRVVRLLYGGRYDVSSGAVSALVVSSVLLAALLLACAVLVSLKRHGSVTLVWGLVAAVVVVILVASPGAASTRAVRGLLFGPAVGLVFAAMRCLSGLRPEPTRT